MYKKIKAWIEKNCTHSKIGGNPQFLRQKCKILWKIGQSLWVFFIFIRKMMERIKYSLAGGFIISAIGVIDWAKGITHGQNDRQSIEATAAPF